MMWILIIDRCGVKAGELSSRVICPRFDMMRFSVSTGLDRRGIVSLCSGGSL